MIDVKLELVSSGVGKSHPTDVFNDPRACGNSRS